MSIEFTGWKSLEIVLSHSGFVSVNAAFWPGCGRRVSFDGGLR